MTDYITVPVEPPTKALVAKFNDWCGHNRWIEAATLNQMWRRFIEVGKAAAPKPDDPRAICEALGFDPANHHNAVKCPYCTPKPDDELLRLERYLSIRHTTEWFKTWHEPVPGGWRTDVNRHFQFEAKQNVLRYLELRGLLERHPDHPEWVRVKESRDER